VPSFWYVPEAYSTAVPALMGRNAAGEGFLRGLLRHSTAPSLSFISLQSDHKGELEDLALKEGFEGALKISRKFDATQLSSDGELFFPGPDIGKLAWARRQFGAKKWSICGITHTTASLRAMDAITDLLSNPIEPWDALICTSNCVRSNVKEIISAQSEYLTERFGITKCTQPNLPVIPLGIHTSDHAIGEGKRVSARAKLGISDEDIVVLYLGRLSFHAKAHPLPMYLALEKAKQRYKNSNIYLIECGWFASEQTREAFKEAAAVSCPNIRLIYLD